MQNTLLPQLVIGTKNDRVLSLFLYYLARFNCPHGVLRLDFSALDFWHFPL